MNESPKQTTGIGRAKPANRIAALQIYALAISNPPDADSRQQEADKLHP
jgi:hypothetical protein